ncbi:hypothetical protein [Agrobacterium rosae]|uniref:Uncharacterized protein n=1 Tax=Agrobacterium rosae TaxID=1972867 RepID=A0A1R3U3N1_9HYPH|nr:hypothetical protein [Agrobacterium rosae]SCX35119.1 hypothetical protein DSM25559_4810 [Agrobacterium rosae]
MKYLERPFMDEREAILQLGRFVPFAAKTIHDSYEQSFHRYCQLQYSPPHLKGGEENIAARQVFYSALKGYFEGQMRSEFIADAIRELDELRVIQTGPHNQMIIEDSTLEALLVSYIGSRANGRKYLFWYSCATNKLETKPKTGAGWLGYNAARINVFGYPRDYLAKTSVVCSSRPASFKLTLNNRGESLAAAVVENIRCILPSEQYESTSDAFRAANENLWSSACPNGQMKLLYFDETFFSQLLVRHIEAETLIVRLLFDDRLRDSLLLYIAEAASRPTGRMLPTGTSLFWLLRDGRIRPIEISGGKFRERGEQNYFIFDRDVVSRMLAEKKLIPDIFVIFLLCNILPGFRCLGGYMQMAYLEAYRQALIHCLPLIDLQAIGLDEASDRRDTNAWGMRVIYGWKPVMELIQENGLSDLLPTLWDKTSSMTLRDLTKSLQQLRTHEHWVEIFKAGSF